MSTQALSQPATRIEPRKFTTAEFLQMDEAGIFAESERVELLSGEVFPMSPIGPSHGGTVDLLTEILRDLTGQSAIVRVQGSIVLNEHSQPQPDFALLERREDYYRSANPLPQNVFLVIEVSHSSLDFDRQKKLPLYALANIPEVWIIDLNKKQIEQFTEPHGEQYTQHTIIPPGKQVTATKLPAVTVTTKQLFG